jgi:hypothetical protein
MNIESLIPKDKFDIETAKKLSNYSFEEIQPIIPDLLEWLQDFNWPVSKTIADFLIPFSENISFQLVEILRGNDEIWKYWILTIFGSIVKDELFLNEIKRIAQKPTNQEVYEEVSELAKEIIVSKF